MIPKTHEQLIGKCRLKERWGELRLMVKHNMRMHLTWNLGTIIHSLQTGLLCCKLEQCISRVLFGSIICRCADSPSDGHRDLSRWDCVVQVQKGRFRIRKIEFYRLSLFQPRTILQEAIW